MFFNLLSAIASFVYNPDLIYFLFGISGSLISLVVFRAALPTRFDFLFLGASTPTEADDSSRFRGFRPRFFTDEFAKSKPFVFGSKCIHWSSIFLSKAARVFKNRLLLLGSFCWLCYKKNIKTHNEEAVKIQFKDIKIT